jgi:hypothetical protein
MDLLDPTVTPSSGDNKLRQRKYQGGPEVKMEAHARQIGDRCAWNCPIPGAWT